MKRGESLQRNRLRAQVILSLSNGQIDHGCKQRMASLTAFSPQPFKVLQHAAQELFV